MSVLLKNNAVSRLSASLTASATALSVMPGDGEKFPSPTNGDWFPLVLVKADTTLEILRCTARSGDVMTVIRAQEGTAAIAFASGDRAELRVTAAALNTVLGGTGATPQFGGIELIASAPFIDFHYGSSSADYTARIVADANNTITVKSAVGTIAQFSENALTAEKVIIGKSGIVSQFGFVRAANGAGGSYSDYDYDGGYSSFTGTGTLITAGKIWHTGNFNPATKGEFSIGVSSFPDNTSNAHLFFRNKDGSERVLAYANSAGNLLFRANGGAITLTIANNGNLSAAGTVFAGNGGSALYGSGDLSGPKWGGFLSDYIDASYAGRGRLGSDIANYAGTVGGVGTYALLGRADGGSAGPSDLAAGSSLFYCSVNSRSGTPATGTWRCMGFSNGGAATIWLRVS